MTDRDETFLNPYTFIPAYPRLPGELGDGPLGNGRPPGRDRLNLGRWTGRIGVTMTVETPLLLLDTPRAAPPTSGEDGHLVYPVRLRNGRPHVAATSIKGMLRAAYEAMTNSRFGVLDDHDKRLGFRRIAQGAGRLKGVRVEAIGAQEATLTLYSTVKPVRFYPARESNEPGGVPYVTGRNIEGKKCERVFQTPQERRVPRAEWDSLVAEWTALMRNYRDAHRDGEQPAQGTVWSAHLRDAEPPTLEPGSKCYARVDPNGAILGLYPVLISRDRYPVAPAALVHLTLRPATSYDEFSLADRVFGWVALSGSGVRPAAYRGRIRIGPVTCDSDAASAVRSFGVDGLPLAILSIPKPTQGRFYLSERRDQPNLPIPDRTPKDKLYARGRGLRGRKAYWHHAGLPDGYWDDPALAEGEQTQTPVGDMYREFRRPHAPKSDKGDLTPDRRAYATTEAEQRDDQNRSVQAWVKPATVFRFQIEVRDFDTVELGALAWLLSLPSGHFHRLGFGKPLGFGSVRLEIDTERTELSSGEQWAEYYRSLTADLPRADAQEVLDSTCAEFAKLLDRYPQLQTIRDAFLAISRGNADLPVHYPRIRREDMDSSVPTPPDPRGRSFEWFTENETESKGAILNDRGRSLPPIGDGGLPIYTVKAPKDNQPPKRNNKNPSHRGKRPQPSRNNKAHPR